MVAEKMTKDAYKYMDGTKVLPLKYAQVFADSVAKALTDKDFQKGYEAVATYFALMQIVSDVNDELDKKYEEFENSVDGKFDAKFADRYPDLAADFIDTYSEILAANVAEILENDEDAELILATDPWAVELPAFMGSWAD